MAFTAVTPIAAVAGALLTIDAAAVDGAVQFQGRLTIPQAETRAYFAGSWVARKGLTAGLSMEGSVSGYVSEAQFGGVLWTKLIAGNTVALVMTDETGAGKDSISGNFILSELSKSDPSDGFVEFTANFRSAGTITLTP